MLVTTLPILREGDFARKSREPLTRHHLILIIFFFFLSFAMIILVLRFIQNPQPTKQELSFIRVLEILYLLIAVLLDGEIYEALFFVELE